MARDVRMLNTGSLLELQRRLRAAGDENIRRSMQRRIRRAAEPLKADLQSTMRGLEIRSQGRSTRPGGPSPNGRPLRATIADAIRISVRTTGGNPGATVWIDQSRLPPDMRNIPARLNEGRLRHPVFGNRRRWVNQYASAWWDQTTRRNRPRMESEVARVLDDVRRRLE
ncbi:hypothetical protein [Streptomyces capitiformicae]|uniref:Uncharacterized protein n=1 Tax=Streptomyces capitiformicae TaxID=2014920 RepID=A0A919L8G9_9ACTN|nr:hypothetical protein [Streptomyces capitiformicae]GHH87808.1 hypothetical protein GCM10017771_30440 [Streptomyces capitiformicae]